MCRISIVPFPFPKPAMAVAAMYRQPAAKAADITATVASLAFGDSVSSLLSSSVRKRVVHFSIIIRIFPIAYLSMLLMSLFSSIVNPSMVNPFGLSSERLALSSRQVVTSVRSVTLLSLMIICLA